MRHLFLHIGMPKTATTSIQRFCAHHASWLQTQGILYPIAGRGLGQTGELKTKHQQLGRAIIGKLRDPDRVHDDAEYCDRTSASHCDAVLRESAGFARVLISCEAFWWLKAEQIPRLMQLLDGFGRVTVIAYVRRQDSLVLSHYCSTIRFGAANMPDFAPWCERQDMDLEQPLARWETVDGRIRLKVRPFVPAAWRHQDILADFFQLIDPDLTPPPTPTPRANAALPLSAIALLRQLNGLDIPDRKTLTRSIRQAFATSPPEHDAGLLTAEIQAQLLARYSASNQRIAERYWSVQEARLFDTQQIETATRPYTGPTAAEAARIIAAIWQSQAPIQPPSQGQEQPG